MAEATITVLALATVVYGLSAGSKLRGARQYAEFRAGLAQAALVPGRLLAVTAALLAIAEAVAAVTLGAALTGLAVAGPGARWLAGAALALATILMAVLSAGVATVIRRGEIVHCACFGTTTSARPLGAQHLVRNILLGVALFAGTASVPLGHGRVSTVSFAAALVGGVSVGLVLTHLDDLVDLFTPVSRTVSRDAR
jgi:hypothetical protein